jgi:hypothetical protein
MVFLRRAALGLWLLSACSGSGGFTEGFKMGKKDEKKGSDESSTKKEQPGKESEDNDASGDQPIQITGTYLTCAEISADDTETSIGCRLADRRNGKTVALSDIAIQWEFDYEVLSQASGEVSMRAGSSQDAWQIFYDFHTVAASDLKKLVAATKILLDLDLKPGAGTSQPGPEFSGLISTFIPAGESETVSGTQEKLDESVVTTGQTDSPPTTNTAQPPDPAPGPTPGPAPGPAPAPATATTNPQTQPQPATTGGSDTPAPAPAGMVTADPVVTFSTVYKAGGAMALTAAFDQDGLSEAKFSGGGAVEATNVKVNSDGSATYRLSAPISVTVKKGSKTCSASGAIITGNMTLPLVCK